MKVELLFPEICNLYGDLANITYLQKSIPELEIVETHLTDVPCFVQAIDGRCDMPDMIYMGTTTERGQLLVIDKLEKYKEQILNCINDGVNFLITGNALEIFGKEIIIKNDGNTSKGLGIFDIIAKRNEITRYNSLYVGDFAIAEGEEAIKIVGFKSLFGFSYGSDVKKNAFDTIIGYGMNDQVKEEGIRVNNFFATYVTGPIFVLNPPFTRWYIKNMLKSDAEPAFWDAAMDAYNSRLAEYMTPGKGWKY